MKAYRLGLLLGGMEKVAYVPYSIIPAAVAGGLVGNKLTGGSEAGTYNGIAAGGVAGVGVEIARMLARRKNQLNQLSQFAGVDIPEVEQKPGEKRFARARRINREAEQEEPLIPASRLLGHLLLGGPLTAPVTGVYAGVENRRKRMLDLLRQGELSPEARKTLALLLSQDGSAQNALTRNN